MKKETQTIFHINNIGNSGSTGRIAEGICKFAVEKGISCHTAYGRWANPSITHLHQIGNKFSIYWHVAMTRLFDRHGLESKKATQQLITQIEETKPDLIHLHNIHGYYLNYPMLFQYLTKLDVPIVWTLHDCWTYTGHCVHYTSVNCNKWKTGCSQCPNLKDYPQSWIWDRSEANYKQKKESFTSLKNLTIVTVSQWLADQVKESFLASYPIIHIYNGIDTEKFTPLPVKSADYGWEHRFIILGVATVWNERKGLSDFIRLSQLLEKDELIVLVGLSEQQIKQLPPNIVGLKKTENIDELVRLYGVADVFINFSPEETFGLTTIDSMACGTPVIVVNSTASPEIVNENVGYVIEPHDIHAAKRKIQEIRRKTKNSYRETCRNYVTQHFNELERYKEYIHLYEKLWKNKNITDNHHL